MEIMADFEISPNSTRWSEGEIQAVEDLQRHQQINRVILAEAVKYLAPFGLLMNAVFLYVVLRIKSMHSIVNIYLTNLAIADTIQITLTLVSLRTDVVASSALLSVAITSLIAPYCFVTALAFERFFAVRRPVEFRATASKSRAAKISTVMWAIALVVGITYGFTDRRNFQLAFLFLTVILHVTLLSVNVFLYIFVLKKLRQQPTVSSTENHHQRMRRVAFMLMTNTVVFFSLNLMLVAEYIFAIVITLSDMSPSSYLQALHSFYDVRLSVAIIQLISASVDPLVYSGTNADYRAAFVEAVFCCDVARRCGSSNGDHPEEQVQQIAMQVIRQEPTQK